MRPEPQTRAYETSPAFSTKNFGEPREADDIRVLDRPSLRIASLIVAVLFLFLPPKIFFPRGCSAATRYPFPSPISSAKAEDHG